MFKIKFLILLILFHFDHTFGATNIINDSITINIIGDFKKHQNFVLEYNNNRICEFGGSNKIMTVKIPFDSTSYESYSNIDLYILKRNRYTRKYKRLLYPFLYYPGTKYISIYYISYICKCFLIFYLPYDKSILPLDNFDKIWE